MFGTVINSNGYKVEFVALNTDSTIQCYKLKDGEQLIKIDWKTANTMLKPRWINNEWVEMATQDEIDEYNAQFQNNGIQLPNLEQRLSALEEAMLENILA